MKKSMYLLYSSRGGSIRIVSNLQFNCFRSKVSRSHLITLRYFISHNTSVNIWRKFITWGNREGGPSSPPVHLSIWSVPAAWDTPQTWTIKMVLLWFWSSSSGSEWIPASQSRVSYKILRPLASVHKVLTVVIVGVQTLRALEEGSGISELSLLFPSPPLLLNFLLTLLSAKSNPLFLSPLKSLLTTQCFRQIIYSKSDLMKG